MMPLNTGALLINGLASDPRQSDQLRARAKDDPEGTLRQVAQQFETLVMDIVLRGMRKTITEDPLFDSDATRMYTDLMDQELARKLANSGQLGLADLMVRQLQQLQASQAPVKNAAPSPITV